MNDVPFVDRPTIERMFGVRARQANYLMRSFNGYKTGQSMLINRLDLIERLDELAAPHGVAIAETQRKATVVAAYNALQRRTRPRRIQPPPPTSHPTMLPYGVTISSPGEIAIRFSSSEELLSAIMALAESANKDFAQFERSLAYSGSRGSVCTYRNDGPAQAADPQAEADHLEEI